MNEPSAVSFSIFFHFANYMPQLTLDEKIARINVAQASPLRSLAVREAKSRTKLKRTLCAPSMTQAVIKRITADLLATKGKKAALDFIVGKLNEPLADTEALLWVRQLKIVQGW